MAHIIPYLFCSVNGGCEDFWKFSRGARSARSEASACRFHVLAKGRNFACADRQTTRLFASPFPQGAALNICVRESRPPPKFSLPPSSAAHFPGVQSLCTPSLPSRHPLLYFQVTGVTRKPTPATTPGDKRETPNRLLQANFSPRVTRSSDRRQIQSDACRYACRPPAPARRLSAIAFTFPPRGTIASFPVIAQFTHVANANRMYNTPRRRGCENSKKI